MKPKAKLPSFMFAHDLPFDPTYGYRLDDLLRVPAPLEPNDFREFWLKRREGVRGFKTCPQLGPVTTTANGWNRQTVTFNSTGGWELKGWLITPKEGPIERGFVRLHGYGGQGEPNGLDAQERAATLYPCLRGLPPSTRAGYPDNAGEHVVFNIEDRDQYILGGCVEDAWLSVSALLELFPQVEGHVGLIGGSFGGGIGSLMLPWDERIARAHLQVPTFGNQPLRLLLPCNGSGNAVTQYFRKTGKIPPTLAYFDAASAARHITIPMHVSNALFDPAVPPPGQFAVYNALPGEKSLHVAQAGHFEYPALAEDEQERFRQMTEFFAGL